MIGRYNRICTSVETEFQRNRDIYGKQIHCGPGCSDCCSQLFQITEIEAAWISHGVGQLAAEQRQRLQAKAGPYLEARNRMVTAQGEQEAWGSLPPRGTRLACPALEDGICTIYDYRPLICRKFGIPLYNPDRPGQVFACELNFKNGDAIDDGRLVQIQTAIHQEWNEVQGEYNRRGFRRDPKPITVARAIIEDFSGFIEWGE